MQDLKISDNFGLQSDSHFMNEEFEIDADADSYEKITVPDFDGGRSSRFIHDFNSVSSNLNCSTFISYLWAGGSAPFCPAVLGGIRTQGFLRKYP